MPLMLDQACVLGWLDFQDSCSRLRACGAARFACLQGKALRAIPAARSMAPLDTAEPAAPDRPGKRPAAMDGRWRTRWRLLRQVVRMRAFLNAGGSCSSRHEGRFTDSSSGIAMERPHHASRPAPQGAAGAFSPVVGWLTWPTSGGVPEKPSGGDAEPAPSPFGAVRPKASLSRCESWRGRGCASGFMAATVRRKQFPRRCAAPRRTNCFCPPGSPLRCDRKRCSPPVPRRPDHNKDAMGANLVQP